MTDISHTVTLDKTKTRAALIDCDVHPVITSSEQLVPYLDQYWADQLAGQMFPSYEPNFHPPNAPIAQRGGLSVNAEGRAATNVEDLVRDVFADGKTDFAILNPLYSIQQIHQPRREAAHARALNTLIAKEWLDKDDRLRSSIVVPMTNIDAAVEEIEHWSQDKRFVQILLLGQSELLLGRTIYWPIWEAAEKHGLPVAIHIGGVFRQAPTSVGWPVTHLEWYVGQQANFEAQILNIISEGIFQKYPNTKVVMTETGFKWVAPFLWKLDKYWNTYRIETPWISSRPSELVRKHFFFTTAPSDGDERDGKLDNTVDRMGSDQMLVYSSDYPHNHHSLPHDFVNGTSSEELVQKIYRDNAFELYGLEAPQR